MRSIARLGLEYTARVPIGRRRQRPAESKWILVADPPLCQAGSPAVAMASCSRGDKCWCTVDVGALSDDVSEVGRRELISDWDVEVASDGIGEVAEVLASLSEQRDDDLGDRLASWSDKLQAIAANGSTLASVDEYQ